MIRTFLGIKRLGGCFGRFTGGTSRGFCPGSGLLVAGGGPGSFEAGGIRPEFATEDSTDGFVTEEIPGDGAGVRDDEGLRTGTSPGGKAMVFEGEPRGRCTGVVVLDPCEPMLRAGTSVVGIVCDSVTMAIFFRSLGGGLGEDFRFGCCEKRPTSA